MTRLLASLLFASFLLPSLPGPAWAQSSPISPTLLAQGFNPEAILNDEDLFDLGGWDAERIQRFLQSKESALATRLLADIDGVAKRPADIFWRVAGSYKISPKYLLALVQKEQSLVETRNPTQKQFDWAAGYGVCDSCAMDDPAIQAYKGFANQLEYAAKQHRERYLFQILSRGTTIGGQGPGKATVIDSLALTPANQATAMLYSYTPHLHGNINLWLIWRRWFARPLPDGTLVVNKDAPTERYLLRDGERRPLTPAVFLSLAGANDKAVPLSAADLAAYPEGDAIRFPNFSLVETPDGQRWLLSGQQKRLIISAKTFKALGFQEDDVIPAETAELEGYADGPDLTERSKYPTGLLAKDAHGALWYVEDGIRHAIPHQAFVKLYFPGRPARKLPASEWNKYPVGDPYRLHDGEVVRGTGDPAVYVIDHGQKRPIRSAETFLVLGYAWKNVLALPDAVLAAYAAGEPLEPSWAGTAPAVAADIPGTASTTLSSSAL